ncbi:MAG: GNAT family N-acetyltransferase [Abitibacteriaceae bacterium]|nr:GNAT family N-acetyltransferase [Abditibacteriaceae bacterium]MBV9864745.1 GNAT family N-acetyltransferase [Abditibacteriaceae bacterium]
MMGVPVEQIRRACESGCMAVVELIANLRLAEQGTIVDRAPILATTLLAVREPACAVFVAEAESEIVGFIIVHWVPFPMLAGMEAYISDLVVAANRRGSGIGQRLVALVEDEARSRGCARLMLNNRIAASSFQRGFYRKLGYRHREDFANFVKSLG